MSVRLLRARDTIIEHTGLSAEELPFVGELLDIKDTHRQWRVAAEVTGGAVGGVRLDTLIGNGLLPLLAAQTGAPLFGWWYCGAAGEVPESISKALKLAGVVGRGAGPWHEGAVQGMLQLALERPAGWGAGAIGCDAESER